MSSSGDKSTREAEIVLTDAMVEAGVRVVASFDRRVAEDEDLAV